MNGKACTCWRLARNGDHERGCDFHIAAEIVPPPPALVHPSAFEMDFHTQPSEPEQPAYCPGCGDPPSKHHNGTYCRPIPDDPEPSGQEPEQPNERITT